jgi:hypothetical protein
MAIIILNLVSLSLGIYFLYSGIIDKPPFEFLQIKKGWFYSKLPNRYCAIVFGIFFITVSIVAFLTPVG